MAWTQYTWMIVIHGIVAWLDAYGIGESSGERRSGAAASWQRAVAAAGSSIFAAGRR
jgi:hypothetical protein